MVCQEVLCCYFKIDEITYIRYFTEFTVFQEYIAKRPDELTIYKGDVIGYVQSALDGWNIGTLLKEPKLFPDNYVKLNAEESSEEAFRNLGTII